MTTYADFIADKVRFDKHYGFDINPDDIHPTLLPHQRDIVQWAVKGGRRAIFAAFGLGKSVMQLETLRIILDDPRSGAGFGRALIVAPLGVRQEFIHDARELLDTEVRFVRRTEDVDPTWWGIHVTNYESVRDGKLDVNIFDAVSLDEAAVLRSFGSKTYQTFLTKFSQVKYRFVATATPSPNRYKELIHYAGFLGVMDTGQALTRFFQRDSTKANNLTLYPHKVDEFHLWLASWAVFASRPSDLGHDDTGYDLPHLNVQFEKVMTTLESDKFERDGQGVIFRDAAMGLQDAAREKRDTMGARIGHLHSILDAWDDDGQLDQVVIWCDLNAEQDALEVSLRDRGITYSSVHGSLDVDEVERRIAEWKAGHTVALIGKPVMLGQGLNLQQCNKAVFVGVTYKFNDTIQAVHRIHRFGQTRTCDVRLIYAETETEIVKTLKEKWAMHDTLRAEMEKVIRRYGLEKSDIATALQRDMGVTRVEAAGEGWRLANNDCVDEATRMGENTVDLIVTSIPFSNHYEYTPNYNDFGHTDDNAHFWAQMDYLTPQLLRVLKPGRIYACHVKDRINFGNVTGAGIPTVSPFHSEAINHGLRHGFDYMGMITVVTDVVRENNQTYRLGWSEMAKDGTKMGVGSPEYILLFHKPQTDRSKGYADVPVTKDKAEYTRARWQVDAHAFWRSSGDRPLTPDELAALPIEDRSRTFTEQTLRGVYDFADHVRTGEILDNRGALPATFMSLAPGSWHPDVWHDVDRMRTLNGEQKRRNVQMHVCPLQFDIVERLIERYSNPGDLVHDPFAGLGTVPLMALKHGRRGSGSELNGGYWADSVKYLLAEERAQAVPTLFDLLDTEAVPA
ncbi:DNA methyltransferase [Luteimicrobium sp. NPDC057192]|uniref:DNA methyltransferase n=1 Tax=Luteimicrobium sp. NPDC057192 TaxID=3346042 RepID=UPI003627EA14